MLKLVDKLFLGNSSAKLCGFKSHCLQESIFNLNKKVKSDFFQWDIVEFLQFNKSTAYKSSKCRILVCKEVDILSSGT